MGFRTLVESSIQDLWQSAVEAFPETRKRQHATDTVQIVQLNWTPFIGMRTLLLRGLAQNFLGEGGEYNTIILVKNVIYRDGPGNGIVPFVASDGREYFMERLSGQEDVLVRCGCGDFRWRFDFYDHLDHSLYGRKRAPYTPVSDRGPINPTHSPGICKHLMKTEIALRHAGLFNA